MIDSHSSNWQIFGHDWAVNLLSQHIIKGTLRHAYLFTGPDGIGKRSLALRFAQAINCPASSIAAAPCGNCRICTQTWAMKQADLAIIKQENDQGELDETGVIKVEQIRSLQHALSLTSFEAKYRIALLLDFHQSNLNAQNALLKTLEEAPEKSIILVTADAAESLLPTISSRCEILRLRPLSIDQIKVILNTKYHIDSELSSQLAHLTRGQLGKAVDLINFPEAIEKRNELIIVLLELLSSNYSRRFEFVEDMTKKSKDRNSAKKNLRFILEVWLSLWRDVILYTSQSSVPPVNIGQQSVITKISDMVDLATCYKVAKTTQDFLIKMEASNLNMQLQLENLMICFPKLHCTNP